MGSCFVAVLREKKEFEFLQVYIGLKINVPFKI